uniref:(California timema) hypothetical protein n=1 Tax=Timema californicum TaxID=61474 RepID=A0A7R9JEX0_TIMCA|nr:unnamed protein product [Timema californicum]
MRVEMDGTWLTGLKSRRLISALTEVEFLASLEGSFQTPEGIVLTGSLVWSVRRQAYLAGRSSKHRPTVFSLKWLRSLEELRDLTGEKAQISISSRRASCHEARFRNVINVDHKETCLSPLSCCSNQNQGKEAGGDNHVLSREGWAWPRCTRYDVIPVVTGNNGRAAFPTDTPADSAIHNGRIRSLLSKTISSSPLSGSSSPGRDSNTGLNVPGV